ncbi:PREDICTED: chromatin accessibility complex protein 1-like [Lupinus angustifolius]|uniref:chromatin accessibility complex protein 1-like n=1 Tax=Lupinus angustifolius TaxID=3871 RepID=UPI00092F8DFA|nr:PREDICTED: chromatin accessibility complex protein 1-like [Lupinus angustifolius]
MVFKGEDPYLRVSQEAIMAINKASENFLEQFTLDAYTRSVQERKKTLSYVHLAHVVSKERRYDFLSDFVPGKVEAENGLRERNSGGIGGG